MLDWNNMKEKDFQTKFLKWLKNNPEKIKGSAAFELKLTKKSSLPFDAVKPHQVDALLAVKSSGLSYKIPDDSRGYKPFDCFRLNTPNAFVVVQFYTPYEKEFFIIDILDWQRLRMDEGAKEKGRKSLTRELAMEYGRPFYLK